MMHLPVNVKNTLDRLHRAGYEAYIVGGCVRDRLLGTEAKDYDITTSARPEETKTVFFGERVIETGLRHGTVTVLLGGMPLEITTYRTDGAYTDGRHPDSVTFTRSLREDAARRDFTMNAIAFSEEDGYLDFFGGQEDIRSRTIRCVGAAERRFSEDALRILRALRFSSVLGFDIEAETAAAAHRCAPLLRCISAERIAVELTKLLCGKNVRQVLLSYADILGTVLPELLPMRGFDQHTPYHVYDVLEHTAVAVEAVPPEPLLRLAAFFHDIGKPACFTQDPDGRGHFYGHPQRSAEIADSVLQRLKFDNLTRTRTVALVRWHDLQIDLTPKSVKRAMQKLSTEDFFNLIALKRADNRAQSPEYATRQQTYDRLEAIANEILSEAQCFSLKQLAVGGTDLLALGMPPGKEVGAALQLLLDAVIDERVPNEKSALLAYLGKHRCSK